MLLLFAYIALLLLPLSFVLGVGAPSLSLVGIIIKALRRGSLSFSWFVVASAACVYEAGLLLVCACRTSAASVGPLPRGSRAVAFPLWLQVLSCSTCGSLFIVHCCINSSSCVLASLALIVIVGIPSAELRPQVVEALLMLPKLCHLDNDLVIIIIIYSIYTA